MKIRTAPAGMKIAANVRPQAVRLPGRSVGVQEMFGASGHGPEQAGKRC